MREAYCAFCKRKATKYINVIIVPVLYCQYCTKIFKAASVGSLELVGQPTKIFSVLLAVEHGMDRWTGSCHSIARHKRILHAVETIR